MRRVVTVAEQQRSTLTNGGPADLGEWFFRYFVYYPVVLARGQAVPAYLKRLKAREYLPATELQALQRERLSRLLIRASQTVPHYRASVRRLPGARGDARQLLHDLPTITKRAIKNDPAAFTSRERLGPLTAKTTGGSTGEPITILKTREAMAWELAATWRGYSWAGIGIGDRQARFWGVPLDRRSRTRARLIDFVAHRRRCSAFAFDDADLARYTDELRRFDPRWFYGYVSMINDYAAFLRRTGTRSPYRLRSIVTTSEVLTDPHRELIEEVLATRVFNEYGSGELGTVAHECEQGSLHLSAENMIVEVLDDERPCEPGEPGELVVTELNNFAMPLIRYRTGDFASLSPRPCRCGRTLPIIENLYGRAYDTIRNRQGKLFHAEYMMYIFEEAHRRRLGVRTFQVVQETLTDFRIRIVPEPGYGSESEEFLSHRIRQGIDPDARISFECVESIDRLPSGKMQTIVGLRE